MSTAVMPSSLYELNEISFSVLKQQDAVAKLGWDSGSEGDVSRSQQLPLSLMTTFILDNINQQHRRLERTQSEPAKVPSLNVNTSRFVTLSLTRTFRWYLPASSAPQAKSYSTSQHQQTQQLSRHQPGFQSSQAITKVYKTELCRPYEESGSCKYGEKCQFAHGGHELRCLVRHPKYKTELCRTFHSVGFCPYGPRCHFIHNAEEARGSKNRPRPLSLGHTDSTASSPPSSLGSASPPPYAFQTGATPPHSPPPPPASPESRLPVFNRISAPTTPTHLFLNNMRFGGELSV